MACRGCLECLLKLLNFILAVAGLGIIGYGVYLFVEFKRATDHSVSFIPTNVNDQSYVSFGRPMLMAVALSSNVFDNLPKAWFIYLFIGMGVVLFVTSCCGCVGTCSRSICCLSCYSLLLILLILAELGAAAFIFFDNSWRDQIPSDKTGNFDTIYHFLKENWNIVRWVALGAVVFEALLFLLALMVRAANTPDEYDSDDEFIAPPRQIRQPFINRQPAPVTGVPVAPTLDQRPSRSDPWSARMREKYGLDTSEFTYNPSESHRFQQMPTQPNEEKGRCTIM
ncbi:hypothetical protein IGI04_036284 [Brassica rapa subsp. trilocularis]|uniref:Tobamovirus multiplication protein 2A n=1 Tax=Brassica rapa subsp. trilocularis TaxID=1813537 RepID=A0ABQ7LE16_BRACM|nr:hypothetical protein IGI04_036284 [Brassica rapa subsp. trilocularis]